ncbi:hypothetical protein PPERSA_00061 [Pseudocohnilembus persalinus]|uniref:Transmembrane protein n=1 Tax=Pseudocohnilembus persalinus TaxID=266149 RepID=A0A0V0Q8L1_PSEPJ|nr:hypothetical protein PPERSA_00061 [Pseudocohnilembus persalinus]|eukprot:KRW98569.1 hypothetical protein PPERSA_00061 [Pseudocohnilembus persalinus]
MKIKSNKNQMNWKIIFGRLIKKLKNQRRNNYLKIQFQRNFYNYALQLNKNLYQLVYKKFHICTIIFNLYFYNQILYSIIKFTNNESLSQILLYLIQLNNIFGLGFVFYIYQINIICQI